jgi:hypothetical protein
VAHVQTGKWKPYENRRGLLKEHDLFLADDRVVPLLPTLLGKQFFNAKKYVQPILGFLSIFFFLFVHPIVHLFLLGSPAFT